MWACFFLQTSLNTWIWLSPRVKEGRKALLYNLHISPVDNRWREWYKPSFEIVHVVHNNPVVSQNRISLVIYMIVLRDIHLVKLKPNCIKSSKITTTEGRHSWLVKFYMRTQPEGIDPYNICHNLYPILTNCFKKNENRYNKIAAKLRSPCASP